MKEGMKGHPQHTHTHTPRSTTRGAIRHPVIGGKVRMSAPSPIAPSPIAPNPGRRLGVIEDRAAELRRGVEEGGHERGCVLCLVGPCVSESVRAPAPGSVSAEQPVCAGLCLLVGPSGCSCRFLHPHPRRPGVVCT